MNAMNLPTDIAGLRAGHATGHRLRSGVTAILFDQPAMAAVSALCHVALPAIVRAIARGVWAAGVPA